MIQENICDDFSLNSEKYATGLCVECHFALRRLKTKEADSIFISEYLGQDVPPNLRSVRRCNCAICLRGRLNGPSFRLEAVKWKEARHTRVLFHPVSDLDVGQPPSPNVPPPVPDEHDHQGPHVEHEDHQDHPEPAPSLEPDDPLDLIRDDSALVVNVVPVSNINNNSTKNSDLEAPEVETSAAVPVLTASPPPEYVETNELGQTLLHLNVQRPGREDKIRDMIERGHPLETEDNEGYIYSAP